METYITFDGAGEPVEIIFDDQAIPVVTGMTADGVMHTAQTTTGHVPPLGCCTHSGALWSDNLLLRCPACRAPMFVPPRFLAGRPRWQIEMMYDLWNAAGWPPWDGDHWRVDHRRTWTLTDHPAFAELGGLPVRRDRHALYARTVAEWTEALQG